MKLGLLETLTMRLPNLQGRNFIHLQLPIFLVALHPYVKETKDPKLEFFEIGNYIYPNHISKKSQLQIKKDFFLFCWGNEGPLGFGHPLTKSLDLGLVFEPQAWLVI